jgi:ribonuclease BN (tRNA processing enzyme)
MIYCDCAVELLVLGKSPAMPDLAGAHSGYLVTHGGFTLLLDCGGGVFASLRALADPIGVDAIVISHIHADHVLDVLTYSFALAHHLGGGRSRRPALWAPPGGRSALAAFATVLGMEGQIEEGFDVSEYDPSGSLDLGPVTLTFREVPHYVRAWACDVRADDGRRLTYGADCGPNDAIVDLAQGTDLMLLEATEGVVPHIAADKRGHLTAAEAGDLARGAGAARLLLTHYSEVLNAEVLRAAAEATFGRNVEMAAQGSRYAI